MVNKILHSMESKSQVVPFLKPDLCVCLSLSGCFSTLTFTMEKEAEDQPGTYS